MNLDGIAETRLDGRTKGIPGTTAPFRLSEIAAKGWNVLEEDMPLPLMVLKRSALAHNAAVFGDYLRAHGLSFAPHGKTTMAPQLYQEQLSSGAWAITAANIAQAQVMHHYGVDRIVLANQLIGKAALASAAAMVNSDRGLALYCFVDSIAQLENMSRNLEGVALAQPIRLLIEIGVAGGRTGLRRAEDATALADAIAASDPGQFRLAGVAGFEGAVPGATKSLDVITDYADRIVAAAEGLSARHLSGLDEFVISGGGSSFFDLMADRFARLDLPLPVRVLLRSGCYLTSDDGIYQRAQEAARADPDRPWQGDLVPAIEVWAHVQSCPEPGLAFLTMGKRDIPHDAGLPIPTKRYRPGTGWLPPGEAEIFATNDQHAFVRLGNGADWAVGDLVGCGISHPCTAFDKWRHVPIVDDEYRVVDGVLTFF